VRASVNNVAKAESSNAMLMMKFPFDDPQGVIRPARRSPRERMPLHCNAAIAVRASIGY
jgi:hypothetical protein